MFTFFRYILCFLVSVLGLQAFPHAPYYTLYGIVRDQVGQTITAEGAEIILLKDNVEIGRAPTNSTLWLDQNYELNIRIDQNSGGTSLYSEKAIPAQGLAPPKSKFLSAPLPVATGERQRGNTLKIELFHKSSATPPSSHPFLNDSNHPHPCLTLTRHAPIGPPSHSFS